MSCEQPLRLWNIGLSSWCDISDRFTVDDCDHVFLNSHVSFGPSQQRLLELQHPGNLFYLSVQGKLRTMQLIGIT